MTILTNHHHHVELSARTSLTFSRHPPYPPLFPAGLQKYILYQHRAAVCRLELVVRPFLVQVKGSTGVHPLMTSSLLLQQCPACLVRLILIVFVMGGWWPYICFVGCRVLDLFNIVHNILVKLLSSISPYV